MCLPLHGARTQALQNFQKHMTGLIAVRPGKVQFQRKLEEGTGVTKPLVRIGPNARLGSWTERSMLRQQLFDDYIKGVRLSNHAVVPLANQERLHEVHATVLQPL
jgi:hypothetical protein